MLGFVFVIFHFGNITPALLPQTQPQSILKEQNNRSELDTGVYIKKEVRPLAHLGDLQGRKKEGWQHGKLL